MKAIEAKQVEDEAYENMHRLEDVMKLTPEWQQYSRALNLWYDSKKLREALETLEGRQ